ncbi:MAG TPA: FAD-binding oxidoreductase [bacterium]
MIKDELYELLKSILGDGGVSVREDDLVSYSRDIWAKTTIEMQNGKMKHLPDAVVWPAVTEDVVKIIKFANENAIPVLPFGGGSGVCGGILACNGGIIIDMKRMDRLLKIDETSLVFSAQTGINGERLERILNEKGFTLGHFPSSIYCSTLGGWLATRSAGQLSTKYGKIEDMVISLEAVLPDGSVLETTPAPRSAAGPGLTQLFVGSEGTLCVITRAIMKMRRLPEKRKFMGIMFSAVENGLDAIRNILQAGVVPAVVRLYDELDTFMIAEGRFHKGHSGIKQLEEDNLKDMILHKAERLLFSHPKIVSLLSPLIPGRSMLILGFDGSEEQVDTDEKISLRICSAAGGKTLGEEPGNIWWETRYKVSYGLSPVFYIGGFADTIEVATTWNNLLNLYYSMKESLSENSLVMVHFSHAYREGCSIYFTFVASAGDERKDEVYDLILKKGMDACVSAGGTISHHHGVGFSKQRWLGRENKGGLNLLKLIKKSLDPKNIMNPGKLGV